MENLLWLIPVLACPLMMVAMMLMMGKGMGMMGKDKEEARADEEPAAPRPVAELQAERDRLDAEIARREDGADAANNRRPSPARHA
jgi:hypothetical protein